MNEVSCRVTALVLDAVEQRGIDPAEMAAHLGLTEGRLRDSAERIDWDAFVALMDRVEARIGGDVSLAQLFVNGPGDRSARGFIRLVANITSAEQLFDLIARWAVPSDLRVATASCSAIDPRHLRMVVSLDETRRGSAPALEFFTGILRNAPVLIGLPAARVTATVTPHVAVYDLVLERGTSLVSATRRGIAALLGSEALEQLARQQEEIIAQNRALEGQLAEQRRIEDELRLSEARFRAAADGSLDAFFLMQALRDESGVIDDFHITDVNRRAIELLRLPRETIVGAKLCVLLPVNRTCGFIDRYARVVETRVSIEEEFSVMIGEQRRWRRHQVVAVGDGIAITTRDVTDQVLAATALRESEERLRLALQAARLGTWSLDLVMRTVQWSEGVSEIFGLGEGTFAGTFEAWDALLHPEDRDAVHDALRRSVEEGTQYAVEHRIVCNDGSIRWISGQGTVLRNDDGSAGRMLGTVADISQRKRLESQLLLADRMISVGTLAAGVAHEINNPLAYVAGNVERMRRHVSSLREQIADPVQIGELEAAIEAIDDGARRVRDIVRDLKTFSRPDEDRRSRIDVRQVIGASVRMVLADMKFRTRLVEEHTDLPPVDGNESRLGQVVINLLVNAAHAMPDRPVSENEIRIRTSVAPEGWVEIEIRDNGVGMSEATLRNIFDPFFTTKDVGEGTGLGLSVCHGIVQSMGGHIAVESELGRGSSFRVRLPRASTTPIMPPVVESPRPRRMRVLVVDDEPVLVDIMRAILEDEGHEVVATTVAREALDIVGNNAGDTYDVILCDLMMPELTGMDLHAQLLASTPHVASRMVFVTGGAVTQRARVFLDQIPNRCLDKPFSAGELLAVLAHAVPGEVG